MINKAKAPTVIPNATMIRYGDKPVGDLRFEIGDGDLPRSCVRFTRGSLTKGFMAGQCEAGKRRTIFGASRKNPGGVAPLDTSVVLH